MLRRQLALDHEHHADEEKVAKRQESVEEMRSRAERGRGRAVGVVLKVRLSSSVAGTYLAVGRCHFDYEADIRPHNKESAGSP